jgi:hypothetical protein
MIHRHRQLAAVLLAAASIFAVTACGSSSSGHTASNAASTAAAHRFGFQISASERTCLKNHGLTLPTANFHRGGRFTRGGKPPAGVRRRFKRGTPPKGGHAGFAGASSKFAKAMKACGVSFPARPGGGPPSAG